MDYMDRKLLCRIIWPRDGWEEITVLTNSTYGYFRNYGIDFIVQMICWIDK